MRVFLRVRQPQGRAPRCPVEDPGVDAEMFPHTLQVSDQLRGRVVAQRHLRVRDVRNGSAAPSLVDSDDPGPGQVESGAVLACAQPSTGTAV